MLKLDTKNSRRDARVSKAIRSAVNLGGKTYPIEDVDGFDAPRVVGDACHYTTRTGIPVRYPNVYSRKGWSSLVYHVSTIRIRVGRGWIIANTEI